MPYVSIVQLGGTIASLDKGRGLEPTKEGEEYLLKELYNLENFRFKVSAPLGPSGVDSSNMTVSQRIKGLKQIEKDLNNNAIDGVVFTHGSDTLLSTAHMGYIGLKGLRKPVFGTFSLKSIGESGYEGFENVRGASRLAGDGSFSSVLLYYRPRFFSVFSRKHGLDLHSPTFDPYKLYDCLGTITKDFEIRCFKKHRYVPYISDVKFIIRRGGKNQIREPVIRVHASHENPGSEIVEWYVKIRNSILNSSGVQREKLDNEFEKMSKYYGIDGEALRRVWIGDYTFFDENFDLDKVPVIHYSLNPFYAPPKVFNSNGVTFIGAGDGHLPLEGRTPKSYTYRHLLRELKDRGIATVIARESGGPVSFRYQIGRELARDFGMFTAGMLSPVEAQVRLSYIVHPNHREFSEKVASSYGVNRLQMENMLFTGGALFYSSEERKWYEKINGIYTGVDLLDTQFTFEEVAILVAEYLSKQRNTQTYVQ